MDLRELMASFIRSFHINSLMRRDGALSPESGDGDVSHIYKIYKPTALIKNLDGGWWSDR